MAAEERQRRRRKGSGGTAVRRSVCRPCVTCLRLAGLGLLILSACPVRAAEDLLRNGSFEEGRYSNGLPHGWDHCGTDSRLVVNPITDVRAVDGRHSVQLRDSSDTRPAGMESHYVPAIAGETYVAAGKIWNVTGRAWLSLAFHDRRRIRQHEEHVKSLRTGVWEDVTVEAAAPSTAEYAVVTLYSSLRNQGESFFDRITLTGRMSKGRPDPWQRRIINRNADEIPDGAYVRVENGHLWADGKPLKLWGAHGTLGRNPDIADREVERFRRLGFNLLRTITTTAVGKPLDYVPNQGAYNDAVDYDLAAVFRSGGYVWLDLANQFRVRREDVDLVDDPDISPDDWLAAMQGEEGSAFGAWTRPTTGIMFWDLRAGEAYLRFLETILYHRNPYTGLTYAEDPSVAVIELMNEQWWVKHGLSGYWFSKCHPALLRSLMKNWNRWLIGRYATTAALRAVWEGLRPQESLEQGTVLLAPLMSSANTERMVEVLGIEKGTGAGEKHNLAVPGNAIRKRDVVRYLMDLHMAFAEKAIARIRACGNPGRGAAVVPIVIDTGCSYSPKSMYEHTLSSAMCCGSYVHQFDTSDLPTRPWLAALKKPPHVNGWLDQNKIEGKPSIIYETMVFNPGKYRADYPLRLLGMMTVQGFDAVNWHYYKPYATCGKEPLAIPTPDHYWNSVIYSMDEVFVASMVLAGTIFRYGNLKASESPTVLVVAKDLLYDGESIGWGGIAEAFASTIYQFGLQMRFDSEREKSEFIGPHGDSDSLPDVFRPTPEIAYRWREGLMTIESPRVRLVAGFLPESFEFAGGERLEGITVHNPEGTPYALRDERFVCFAMCARDGRPLEESGDIVAMAVSTSWSKDFAFDVDKWTALQEETPHPPLNAARSVKRGTTPVRVCRVGWALQAPWLSGKLVQKIRFDLKEIGQETVTDGLLEVGCDEELFLLEISNRRPGQAWPLRYRDGGENLRSTGNPWKDEDGQERWILGHMDGDRVPHEPDRMIWSAGKGAKGGSGTSQWGKPEARQGVYHPAVAPMPTETSVRMTDCATDGPAKGKGVIAFVVPQPGTYAVSGTLGFADYSEVDKGKAAIAWKVVRTGEDPEDYRELVSGVNTTGDRVDLAELEALRRIRCAQGDHIALVMWRSRWHYYSHMTVDGYGFRLVE